MAATHTNSNLSSPAEGDPEVFHLYGSLTARAAKLVGADGIPEPLPPDLRAFLMRLCDSATAAEPITLVEDESEFTTAEAARVLSVSRQFLVGLLEENQIPFHKTGTHRRVYARDVYAYKARRDAERRKILDDLLRAEIEEGLIDLVPMHGPDAG